MNFNHFLTGTPVQLLISFLFVLPYLLAAQFWKLHISLQKWFSMDFVALPSANLVNFVNLFYLTRMFF